MIIRIAKTLSAKHGGSWQYNRKTRQWFSDDNNRYVHWVLTGKDFDGEYTGDCSLCMYYKDNSKSPEWIYL